MPVQRTGTARPSTLASREPGSTPAPASWIATRSVVPLRPTSRTDGGVTSFTQKRNVKRPARLELGLSNTMSYAPGVGRTAPATGADSRKFFAYGLSARGRPG